jgi:hypothetical protein
LTYKFERNRCDAVIRRTRGKEIRRRNAAGKVSAKVRGPVDETGDTRTDNRTQNDRYYHTNEKSFVHVFNTSKWVLPMRHGLILN